jgi:adenylosuccinate synthase
MDWNLLKKAININGVTNLVLNKVDVLEEVGQQKILVDEKVVNFDSMSLMKEFIKTNMKKGVITSFSSNKESI